MFNPSLWRMKKFADSVPEMMNLQQGNQPTLFQCRAKYDIGLSGNKCLGKR